MLCQSRLANKTHDEKPVSPTSPLPYRLPSSSAASSRVYPATTRDSNPAPGVTRHCLQKQRNRTLPFKPRRMPDSDTSPFSEVYLARPAGLGGGGGAAWCRRGTATPS